VRSTDNNFSIETHILTENGQWKMDNEKWTMENGNVQIEFLEYLRENRKFENLKELKKQIEEDIKKAKSLEINRNSKPTK
jgi:riboflavin kinase/FMN adenylyltransferase